MPDEMTRRRMMVEAGACLGAASAATTAGTAAGASRAATKPPAEPFGYCLNMATIMGQKRSLVEEIELAAKAGWQGIEPWIRNLERHVRDGGSLDDVKRRIDDLGLQVASAIGFTRWAVDDDQKRAEGFEQFKREMDMVAQIGGTHIAAPPAGINRNSGMDLFQIARRYGDLLELGEQTGVIPQLEIWGSSLTLGRMGEAALVAAESGHPSACLLLDAYHIYKSGSPFCGLKLLNGAAMHAFHINDYPDDPPRETINDSQRVMPGDGVCPLPMVLRTLYNTGFRGMLSLELFNRDYWQQDALAVAKLGLEKTRQVVRETFS